MNGYLSVMRDGDVFPWTFTVIDTAGSREVIGSGTASTKAEAENAGREFRYRWECQEV